MWFVHHLSTAAQSLFAKENVLPQLPLREHSQEGDDAVTKLYTEKVTCQKCHVGGIPNQGLPEVAPDTPKALARRCYTNYKDLFNITCGPCDGISGIYTGDADKYFTAPPCTIIAQPEDVPVADRVPPKIPFQFEVNVTGSDRFGRTTNPAHSSLIGKTYGQIRGKWYMNVEPDSDLWLLRHDTTYNEISVDGFHVPFFTSASVSEIHSQTSAQKAANITGPMVSLVKGLPSWIPGGCTCIPDPVGVPDITATQATGLDHMEYLGRIKLDPIEFLGRTIELDHWADWFFHIFMETNSSSPHYGVAPRRLSSAYAGMSVYQDWILGDPLPNNPNLWNRGIPTQKTVKGEYCLNAKGADVAPFCNINATNFPPAPEPGPHAVHSLAGSSPHTAEGFFPRHAALGAAIEGALEKMKASHA